MVKKGDRVSFKPEYQDAGDLDVVFVAVEDEDGGRVLVESCLGMAINPIQRVAVEMLAACEDCGELGRCAPSCHQLTDSDSQEVSC